MIKKPTATYWETFGPFNRYACKLHIDARMGTGDWYFVQDAEVIDEVVGLPAIVKQTQDWEEIEAFVKNVEAMGG